MKTMYLVVNHDIEGASIDKDCVFESKDLAEIMCKNLTQKYPEQNFSVCSIEIESKGDNRIADAIDHHAEAMDKIATALNEFVVCSCTVDALGKTLINPTFNIKEDNK